jgi:hypothetical protein
MLFCAFLNFLAFVEKYVVASKGKLKALFILIADLEW